MCVCKSKRFKIYRSINYTLTLFKNVNLIHIDKTIFKRNIFMKCLRNKIDLEPKEEKKKLTVSTTFCFTGSMPHFV